MNNILLDKAMRLIAELEEYEEFTQILNHDHGLAIELDQLESDYRILRRNK